MVNTTPSEVYDAKNLDFAKLTDIEVLDNGRLWASVLGGGENEKGFLLLAYSDNGGKAWQKEGMKEEEQNLIHDGTVEREERTLCTLISLSP